MICECHQPSRSQFPWNLISLVPPGLLLPLSSFLSFLLGSYYCKIPFDVKAILYVAKHELIDQDKVCQFSIRNSQLCYLSTLHLKKECYPLIHHPLLFSLSIHSKSITENGTIQEGLSKTESNLQFIKPAIPQKSIVRGRF